MKPLCHLCETRHESYQGHVFKKPVANAVANKSFHEDVSAGLKRVIGKAKKRYLDQDKRRAYMRELMRKRRAGSA